ncbi:YqjK family protein [Klebsiella sp. S69]|uniref:YqjK family protein n=1 Tax=Klebsiella sp. S69 TaxID=2767439 RepID=UPI0019031981|nr:YqjK-like family protein [Klebsiella sp. S69]
MNKLQIRKSKILKEISSQRNEVHRLCDSLMVKLQPVDTVWSTVYRLRGPLILISGIMVLKNKRKSPKQLLITVRRAAGLWSSMRLLRKYTTLGK